MSEPPGRSVRRSRADRLTVHVVGIGGAGMSAIATALQAMGHAVTGSDLKASAVTERLRAGRHPGGHRPRRRQRGLRRPGHRVLGHPRGQPRDRRGPATRASPCCPGPRSLAAIASLKRCLAVAGTHGKTTTASMLALQLVEGGTQPSFLIGGDVNEIGTNAVWDDGEWLVVEADESDGTFLALDARHRRGHQRRGRPPRPLRVLRRRAVGLRGVRGRRPAQPGGRGRRPGGRRDRAGHAGADVVGTAPGCTYRMVDLDLARSSVAFGLVGPDGAALGRLAVPVPGLHNARNAAVATVAALPPGCPSTPRPGPWPGSPGWPAGSSSGATVNGVTFVDDYAHLPTEVRAALAAARNGDWRRVVAVFQPHRYSRTAELGSRVRRGLRRRRRGGGDRRLRGRRGPGARGLRPAGGRRRPARAFPDMPVLLRAGSGRRCVARWADLLEAGDLCCTLGRRRPHLAARRADGRSEVVTGR